MRVKANEECSESKDIQVVPCARCSIPIAIDSHAGEWNCCDVCTSFLEFQDDGI